MSHTFAALDVFTGTPLAGNPLAVVFDADDLDTDRMQAIAREFNLSETVFILTPRDPVNSARIRIFTPARELPFAGHPTVGTAVLLAERRAPEIIARQDLSVVLEEEIGPVTCTVRRHRGVTRASFALPRLPERLPDRLDDDAVAAALGLVPADLGFLGHETAIASAGVAFSFVPLGGIAAARRAKPDPALWLKAFGDRGAFLYTAECEQAEAHLHARMFAPGLGLAEDPATGSAVAALAALLVDDLADGDHTVVVEQGIEMGRPSLITLGLEIEGGALIAASVGGSAVVVSGGTLEL